MFNDHLIVNRDKNWHWDSKTKSIPKSVEIDKNVLKKSPYLFNGSFDSKSDDLSLNFCSKLKLNIRATKESVLFLRKAVILLMIARPVIKQNEFTQQWQCDVLLTSEEKRCLLIKIGSVNFFQS